MAPQDDGGLFRRRLGAPSDEAATEGGSLDELAKGLASGTISRSKALKVVGAAFLGAVTVGLFPVAAEAKGGHHHHRGRRRRKPPKPSSCTNGGCIQCGKPTKPGEACVCLTTTEGQNLCINGTQGNFTACTTSGDCTTSGEVCADFSTCGMGTGKQCVTPCSG